MKFSLQELKPGNQDVIREANQNGGFCFDDGRFNAPWLVAHASNAIVQTLLKIKDEHGNLFDERLGGVGDFGCIVEFCPYDSAKPSYRFKAGPSIGRPKNLAMPKLVWLRAADLTYTSPMTKSAMMEVVKPKIGNDQQRLTKFMEGYATTDAMTRADIERLSAKYGIVPCYGAFRCNYTIGISTDGGFNTEIIFDGLVYVSFDGANMGVYDLPFALMVFESIHNEFTSGSVSPYVQNCAFDDICAGEQLVADHFFVRCWHGMLSQLGYSY